MTPTDVERATRWHKAMAGTVIDAPRSFGMHVAMIQVVVSGMPPAIVIDAKGISTGIHWYPVDGGPVFRSWRDVTADLGQF